MKNEKCKMKNVKCKIASGLHAPHGNQVVNANLLYILHFTFYILHFAFIPFIVLIASFAGPAGSASADEEPLRFLDALRKNGYADMAVEYLRILDRRPDLPPEVRAAWDLEMSESLRAAAEDAFDQREYQRLIDQSHTHLAKFIREHPDHPAAAEAMISWAEFLGQRALGRWATAKNLAGKDPRRRQALLNEARDELSRAREMFARAARLCERRLADLPPPPKNAARTKTRDRQAEKRAHCRADVLETRFQIALADYYLAQTYAEPKSQQRIEKLQQAADGFDAIFQQQRAEGEALSVIGLRAHLWHGKTAEELGDLQLAMDIYDEVLVGAAEPGRRGAATGLEPLFAQVEYFRMSILAEKEPERFLAEAADWLERNRGRLRETDGYQGVALAVARALLAKARDAAGPEKRKTTAEALRLLTDMSRVPGSHRQDAILLRRELLLAAGRSGAEIDTFDEAVAVAAAAAESGQWPRARDLYRRALELAEKNAHKDRSRTDAVAEALAGAELMIARELFDRGELKECIAAAGRIVYEDREKKIVRRDGDAAPQAAALSVFAALNLYANAPEEEKPHALARLIELAEFTESNWPDRPEADDARMARGRAKLYVGRTGEAIDIFERVNPKSSRFPQAMYYAGRNYARLYLAEKNKPADRRDDEQLAAWRERAIERLGAAVDALSEQFEPDKPPPDYFLQSQLLLAEIHADAGRHRRAADLYRPLIDFVTANEPIDFDRTTIRVFLGAVRAYAAVGGFDKAAEAADLLIESGPDSIRVNDVLVRFAGLLDMERKKALAAVTELKSTTNTAETQAAEEKLEKINNLLGRTLVKLGRRKQVSVWGMVFVADRLNELGKTDEAGRLYRNIIDRAESDPDFAASARKALTRVRAQLLGLLRKEGDFAEALRQVDRLIEDNPRALEPLMEKGRILEDRAKNDPSKYDRAVAHWVMLRNRLQRMRKKPAEYYDVTYHLAACLVREAENAEDEAAARDRAKKAEQVLKAVLVLNPKLNGPDAVARYKVLLNKAIALQGRSPEE